MWYTSIRSMCLGYLPFFLFYKRPNNYGIEGTSTKVVQKCAGGIGLDI